METPIFSCGALLTSVEMGLFMKSRKFEDKAEDIFIG
jgi:hypothetical protein